MWLGADTSGSNLGLGADASGPECHVAVELPQLIELFAKTQVPSGVGVCLAHWSRPSAKYPCVGSVIARCPLSMACSHTKTCVDHFLLNHPFNSKCTLVKRQPYPSSTALATLCVKGWVAITLLQSTVLYVYVNNNRDTKPF